jgi:glycosyltransferase involved in cell wall biosynthesis
MPNLLFIAYPFPPAPASGANRTWPLAKYLSRMGWSVTVVSAREAGFTRRQAALAMADACRAEGITWIQCGSGPWAQDEADNQLPALEWMKSLMRRYLQGLARRVLPIGWADVWCFSCAARVTLGGVQRPDVILATGMPFGSFILARLLARRFQAPYVLDYRDPWSANPYRSARRKGGTSEPFERWVLSRAFATIMVSQSQASAQHQRFPQFPRPSVVTNGYDPDQLRRVEERRKASFTMVYAGILYPGKRDLDPILASIARARQLCNGTGRQIEFQYYGPQDGIVRKAAERFGVSDMVSLHGSVSRDRALSAVKSADVSVVVTGMSEEATAAERGIMTGKIFEALGLGTPVLLVCPRNGDARQLLAGTQGAAFCASEIDGIARWIASRAQGPSIKSEPPVNCSWVTLACQVDELLRDAVVADPVSETS